MPFLHFFCRLFCRWAALADFSRRLRCIRPMTFVSQSRGGARVAALRDMPSTADLLLTNPTPSHASDMEKKNVQVLTADETGLVKVIDFAGPKVSSRKFGLQSSGHGVSHMSWCSNDEKEILTATRSGVIRIWNAASSTAVRQYNFVVENDAENASHQQYAGVGRLKGLEVLGSADDRRRALTIAENGDAFLFALPVDGSDDSESAADDSASVLRFSVGSDTRAFHVEPVHQKQFVVGGKENDVALWDIETRQQTFKCKNVPHDKLNLRQPVWVNAVKFMQPSHTIVTGTAHHQVRLYDVRAQNRPVLDVEVGNYQVTCVAPVPSAFIAQWSQDFPIRAIKGTASSPPALNSIDTPYIVVADGFGTISLRDVRKNLAVVGNFKGNAGSVRSVCLHPSLPLLAAVGLDRHLRIYNISTQRVIKKVYLKQRQNAVIFSAQCDNLIDKTAQLAEEAAAAADEEEDAAGDGSVWSHLDQNAAAVSALSSASAQHQRLKQMRSHASKTASAAEDEGSGSGEDDEDEDEDEDDDDDDEDDEDDEDDDDDDEEEEEVVEVKTRRPAARPAAIKRKIEVKANAGKRSKQGK